MAVLIIHLVWRAHSNFVTAQLRPINPKLDEKLIKNSIYNLIVLL